jgi:hypothetical protein
VASVTTVAALSIAALTGCSTGSTNAAAAASASATSTPVAQPTTAPAPTTSVAPSGAISGTPVGITCSELLPDEVVKTINPGFVAQGAFTPEGSSYPATIVSINGVACGWTNASTGDTLVVAVAKPAADSLKSLEATVAAAGTATSAFGAAPSIRGYEAQSGGTSSGDMEVFSEEGYWISATSGLFHTPDDAKSTISAILETLPSG